MKRLDGVDERGTISLFEDVSPDLDDAVRADTDEVAIEGHVMELAQRQSITNEGGTLGFRVGHYVRCIEQLLVPEPAQRALVPVRLEDSLPERSLMESLANGGRDVLPSSRLPLIVGCV